MSIQDNKQNGSALENENQRASQTRRARRSSRDKNRLPKQAAIIARQISTAVSVRPDMGLDRSYQKAVAALLLRTRQMLGLQETPGATDLRAVRVAQLAATEKRLAVENLARGFDNQHSCRYRPKEDRDFLPSKITNTTGQCRAFTSLSAYGIAAVKRLDVESSAKGLDNLHPGECRPQKNRGFLSSQITNASGQCRAFKSLSASEIAAGSASGPGTEKKYTSAGTQSTQAGFSLVEVSIVTAIVLLIAVIGIPAISSYVMENRVPKVGQELARFVMNTRVNADTLGPAPYAGIGNANLRSMMADSTVLTSTTDGKVLHGLGTAGQVEIEATDAGQGFLLRLKQVNHVACPSIASILQRVANRITVSAGGAAQVLKDDRTPYSALAAESACGRGNVNQFEFYVS